jgi:hypothetical protein
MLDEAWPRYAGALGVIRRGAAGIKPPPKETLQAVAKLLGADIPVKVTLLVFVGDFVFTATGANQPTVAIPVGRNGFGFVHESRVHPCGGGGGGALVRRNRKIS